MIESQQLTSKPASFCKQEGAPGHQEEESCFQQGEAVQLGKLRHVKSFVKGSKKKFFDFSVRSIYGKHLCANERLLENKIFLMLKNKFHHIKTKLQNQGLPLATVNFCCISMA